jgi:hypothetical protein
MGIDIPAVHDRESLSDMFEIPRHGAKYTIAWTRGATSNPDIASQAQRIHGLSYVDYGYFHRNGLAEDGRLVPELDGTREKSEHNTVINYLLAIPKSAPLEEAEATLRMIDIGENGTIEDLPTYKYFKEGMSKDVQEKLKKVVELYGIESVREVAALATVGKTGHLGSYELMRAIMQNSLIKKEQRGYGELFVTAMTEKSLRPVADFAGAEAIEIIGDPVQIFGGDERAAEIFVTPVIIDPNKVIDGILNDIARATYDTERVALRNKLLFLVDGLTNAQIGERGMDYIHSLAA